MIEPKDTLQSNTTYCKLEKGDSRRYKAFVALIAFVGAAIGYLTYDSGQLDARTDLYVDFKDKFKTIRIALSEPKPYLTINIKDCNLLWDKELILGDQKLYSGLCEIKYYASDKRWHALQDYWRHSFDEWFASKELGLSSKLWKKYYRHAVFQALQKSDKQRVLCYMINGGSSFSAHVKQFRIQMRDLFNKEVLSRYRNRWNNKIDAYRPPDSSKQMGSKNFDDVPDCLVENTEKSVTSDTSYLANKNYIEFEGFKDKKTHDLFMCIVDNLRTKLTEKDWNSDENEKMPTIEKKFDASKLVPIVSQCESQKLTSQKFTITMNDTSARQVFIDQYYHGVK